MKIVVVNGSLAHYDHGLGKVVATINSTLTELGMEVDLINLNFTPVPYFDGMRAQAMDDMVLRMRAAAGIVFACTCQLFAPSAIMQAFLEFLECADYKDVLFEKHCLLAVVSKAGGERSALEYLARMVCFLGAYESGRIGLQEIHSRSIPDNLEVPNNVKDIIEKETEDFYRAIRQNRKCIMPMDSIPPVVSPPAYIIPEPAQQYQQPNLQMPVQQHDMQPHVPQYQQPNQYLPNQQISNQQILSQQIPNQQNPQHVYTSASGPPASDAARKLNLDAFTERQEEDIRELTALFSQKYSPEASAYPVSPSASQALPQAQPAPQQPTPRPPQPVPQHMAQPLGQPTHHPGARLPGVYQQAATPSPKTRTVKQLTQSLPHYYQPQMASGLTAVIQISITGAEAFDGYLKIVDSECEYTDGFAENPEITIISDSNTWGDVLKGKHTAQKAFMIGGLKVRGNFVLLTKFDSLFKF